MVDPIKGPKNTARIHSAPRTARTIAAKELMNSMAIKPAHMQWQLTGDYKSIRWLKKTISLQHPLINETRYAICQMDDNRIMEEEKVILDRFLNIMKPHLAPGFWPNLEELVEKGKNPVCVEQFYSSKLTNCSLLFDHTDYLHTMTPHVIVDDYKKTLIFTIALDIESKRHDFSPYLKKLLCGKYPEFEKNIEPANYLSILKVNELLKTGYLLWLIDKAMGIDYNDVMIKNKLPGSNDIAVINNGLLTVNLRELLKTGTSASLIDKERIKIEK